MRQTVSNYSDSKAFLISSILTPDTSYAEELAGRVGDELTLVHGLSGRHHSECRRLLQTIWSESAVSLWHEDFRQVASEWIIRATDGHSSMDLVSSYVRPSAADCALRFLGLPPERAESIGRLSNAVMSDMNPIRRERAGASLFQFLRSHIQASKFHEDGAIPRMLTSGLSVADVIGVSLTMLSGGLDLAVKAAATWILASGVLDGAVPVRPTETLRVETLIAVSGVLKYVDRTAIGTGTVAGNHVTEGDRFRVMINEVALGEKPLVFGSGAHRCIGFAWVLAVIQQLDAVLRAHTTPLVVNEVFMSTTEASDGPKRILCDF